MGLEGAHAGLWAPYVQLDRIDRSCTSPSEAMPESRDRTEASGAVVFYVLVSQNSRGRGTQVDGEQSAGSMASLSAQQRAALARFQLAPRPRMGAGASKQGPVMRAALEATSIPRAARPPMAAGSAAVSALMESPARAGAKESAAHASKSPQRGPVERVRAGAGVQSYDGEPLGSLGTHHDVRAMAAQAGSLQSLASNMAPGQCQPVPLAVLRAQMPVPDEKNPIKLDCLQLAAGRDALGQLGASQGPTAVGQA